MAHAAARSTPAERERLVELFVRLCEIESPSGDERAMADAVIAELRESGLEPEEDSSGPRTGSNAGNVLARVPGPAGAPTVLLCAHLDTVPLAGPIEVVEEEGMLSNRHAAILGADNKAAVAVFLMVARRAAATPPAVGVELLFTTGEELALAGAKALEPSWLRADLGFVFDHAEDVGWLAVAAPTYYRIEATFLGQAAHAGIRPERGRNAIAAAALAISRLRLGRLDERTTANVGRIEGGSAANVVAERCYVELEARSIDDQRADEVVVEMVDAITEAASDAECDVETHVQLMFRGYRLARSSPPVELAQRALESVGVEPQLGPSGGGSDANVFNAAGLPCLNVANGTERNHQPDERVSRQALETMLDVALALVERAA